MMILCLRCFVLSAIILIASTRNDDNRNHPEFAHHPSMKHIPGLPPVTMFYHIPKTGGSSVRKVMSKEYQNKYPWGAGYSNIACGVKKASSFHLTYDEMISCGINPIPGPSLCVVREPVSRFESEVRWRANMKDGWIGDESSRYVERMIFECQKARRYIKADVFSHCQPQSHYLYKGLYKPKTQQFGLVRPSTLLEEKMKEEPQREALCDYLLSDLSKHEQLLKAILGSYVPRENSSINKTGTDDIEPWELSQKEIEWIKSFYREDFEDDAIQQALEGKVLRRNGTTYKVINISTDFPL